MKKIVLGLGTLALVIGTLGLTAGTTLAYRGEMGTNGPNYSPERHVAMEEAFENGDYQTWTKLMADVPGRVRQVITQENFAKFAQIHQLVESGRYEEAKALRAELGLGLRNGAGRGMGQHLNR